MNNYNSEIGLIDLIKKQNPKGFKLLYDKYSCLLYGSIIVMVNNHAIAENLLIETFIKIRKNIHQYDHIQLSFLTWLLQVARSVSIDYLCVAKQRDNDFVENHQGVKSVIGSVHRVMIPATVEMEVLNMAFRGHKADEIAKKLNMPIETVKINLRKGIKLKGICNNWKT